MTHAFVELLGTNLKAALKNPCIKSLKTKPVVKHYKELFQTYATLGSAGLMIVADDDGRVSSIQMSSGLVDDEFARFPNELPDGLTFEMSQKAVRKKLGKPSESQKLQKDPLLGDVLAFDLFTMPDYILNVSYRKGLGSIAEVCVLRPDAFEE